MKRFGVLALIAVLVLGLAVYFAACGGGGGGGDSGSSITSIATTTQGAQAASATSTATLALTGSNSKLSGIVGGMPSPKFKLPSSTTTNGKILNKLTAHFGPALKRARALKASYASAGGYPVTYDCATGMAVTGGSTATPDSWTLDISADYSTMTVTYNNCREGSTLTNGVLKMVGTSASATFTLGTSDANPYSLTDYPDSVSTTPDDVTKAYLTMSFTESGTTTITDSMVLSGWYEEWDYVLDSHDKLVVSSFSMSDVLSAAAVTINSVAYDVDTMTFNGSMTGTIYSSSTATTVSFSETNSYHNFSVAYKTPVDPTASIYYYGSINGTFSISTTPADQCINGTFSIVTNNDIKFDSVLWQTAGGQITINGNTVVVFDANGGVTVSVNGGAAQPYTKTELASLCAL